MEVIWSRLYALRAFGATAAMIASSSTTALTSAANRHEFQQPAAACVGRRGLDERERAPGVWRGELRGGQSRPWFGRTVEHWRKLQRRGLGQEACGDGWNIDLIIRHG